MCEIFDIRLLGFLDMLWLAPGISTKIVGIFLIFKAWYSCFDSLGGVLKSSIPTITIVGVWIFFTKDKGEKFKYFWKLSKGWPGKRNKSFDK